MSRWNPIVLNAPKDVSADETFDLKGEICPYTFVKSKLMLEMMESGQILRVIVDNDESATNDMDRNQPPPTSVTISI